MQEMCTMEVSGIVGPLCCILKYGRRLFNENILIKYATETVLNVDQVITLFKVDQVGTVSQFVIS